MIIIKKKTLFNVPKFFEKFNLPYGYFNGKEVIPNKDRINFKKASDLEKDIYRYKKPYCVKSKSNEVSLAKAAEEIREHFEYEEELLKEGEILFKHYDYIPKVWQKYNIESVFCF